LHRRIPDFASLHPGYARFFKREAKKRRVPYQRMIRALVDTYAERQAGGKS
jgi:hypothetical protein